MNDQMLILGIDQKFGLSFRRSDSKSFSNDIDFNIFKDQNLFVGLF